MQDLREILYALSPRQQEIVRLQRAGYSQPEIMVELGLRVRTFRWHAYRIRKHLPNFICATTHAPIPLTRREKQIVCLVEAGYTNKEIALHLQISLNTVKTRLQHLYDRTEASNRLDLVLQLRSAQRVVA